MTDLLPCLYATVLIVGAAALGYWAGRYREQLSLLEIFKPGR